MIALGIETATVSLGVAVTVDGEERSSLVAEAGRRHVEGLHPLIVSCLRDAGLKLSELDVIGVDVGPGRFTGMRVGMSAASALGFALHIPVVGVASTTALLSEAPAGAALDVAIVDLRRGELAVCFGDDPTTIARVSLGEIGALLIATANGRQVLARGDGALCFESEILAAAPELALDIDRRRDGSPDAALIAAIADTTLAGSNAQDLAPLLPIYLRDADVRISWSTRDDVAPVSGR